MGTWNVGVYCDDGGTVNVGGSVVGHQTVTSGEGPGGGTPEWAEGYQRAQAAWTGMRPEDYPRGPEQE